MKISTYKSALHGRMKDVDRKATKAYAETTPL